MYKFELFFGIADSSLYPNHIAFSYHSVRGFLFFFLCLSRQTCFFFFCCLASPPGLCPTPVGDLVHVKYMERQQRQPEVQ